MKVNPNQFQGAPLQHPAEEGEIREQKVSPLTDLTVLHYGNQDDSRFWQPQPLG